MDLIKLNGPSLEFASSIIGCYVHCSVFCSYNKCYSIQL